MTTNAYDFLEQVLDELDYRNGTGFYSVDTPSIQLNLSQIPWLEQARHLGAESIFFVDDYPTVLFFRHDAALHADTGEIEEQIYQLFLRVWNTSRVPLFFVALPGEIRVYNAYQKPLKPDEWLLTDRWLKRIQSLTELAELSEFSRAQVESGQLFQQRSGTFDRQNRVDHWLLRNLRLLRQRLEGTNRARREYVHALIGRSIFIRYLEDRRVLVEDYFADLDPSRTYTCYTDVLQSKAETYHLFRKLRGDFNGDLFPFNQYEEAAIEEADLHLLRDFLLGKSMGNQLSLLFWAYQFDIIPIELISNIYEEFYHQHGDQDDKGTHYTPTTLVDFVLSQCLTKERLDKKARVLDPACGSGIFLVEAFKRMVYHACRSRNVTRLSQDELTQLLTEQIVGFDVNKSAIQIAAFSLYLAYLDFREPPDIRANKQLPKLIYDPESLANSGRNLFHTNAFALTAAEKAELEERVALPKPYKGKASDLRALDMPVLPIDRTLFDVIVGNPPWGADASSAGEMAVQWCNAFRYPVGYKELSQCFIWRMQKLLSPEGEVGLLVSTGILFKHQDNSKEFRQQWLSQSKVRAVYNFAHVRQIFFQDAIAPFAVVFFGLGSAKILQRHKLSYITIKRQAFIEKLQSVIIDRDDLHKVRQSDFLSNDWLWKAYMWGGINDIELVGEVRTCHPTFGTVIDDITENASRGFGNFKGTHTTAELLVDYELRNEDFDKSFSLAELRIPLKQRTLRRVGKPQLYQGDRLIVKRGISKAEPKFGEIQARLAYAPFAFTDNFIGFRIDSLIKEQQQVLLGIFLSSLAKYYHFLTCYMWGLWNDKISTSEHLQLPICFPDGEALKTRILNAVNQITNADSSQGTLFSPEQPHWYTMQEELDEAIFDLYALSEPQRDLVRDMCQTTLEFFYEGTEAQAVQPPSMDWLASYQSAFLEIWQERLAERGKELEIRIFAPRHGLLVGMVFELVDLGTAQPYQPITDDAGWQRWFRRLSNTLRQRLTENIYIDRTFKELTDSSIILIKRAERRLWTKSMARQDAQELLMEVFKLEWEQARSLA